MTIYKNYNQSELDLQFNNRHHVPEFETYFTRWAKSSRLAEKKHIISKNVRYGNLPREYLDIFPSPSSSAKTLIFIHGGYWQMFDTALFYFVADAFADYGVTTILLNYPLAPAASITQIVDSCHNAIDWLRNSSTMDGRQVYLVGHSAGAHLAVMMLDARSGKNIRPDFINGVCAISGLYNLIPVQLSGLNKTLQLEREEAIRNSPIYLPPLNTCSVTLAVGEKETAEFNSQSRELHAAWKDKSNISLLGLPGLNHFSALDSIHDPDSLLHRTITSQMNL